MQFSREILKGHLRTLVLAALEKQACHAYGLSEAIQEMSMGVFEFSEGTAYPTLNKLEKDGVIEATWLQRESGPDIKQYKLTDKGKKELEDRKKDWKTFSRAMNLVLYDQLTAQN